MFYYTDFIYYIVGYLATLASSDISVPGGHFE